MDVGHVLMDQGVYTSMIYVMDIGGVIIVRMRMRLFVEVTNSSYHILVYIYVYFIKVYMLFGLFLYFTDCLSQYRCCSNCHWFLPIEYYSKYYTCSSSHCYLSIGYHISDAEKEQPKKRQSRETCNTCHRRRIKPKTKITTQYLLDNTVHKQTQIT